MKTVQSDRVDELAKAKEWDFVQEEADATCVASYEGDELLCFENGFDLAMKAVQMGAMEKYAGKSLQVFTASNNSNVWIYLIAADEDEACARLSPLPDADPEEDETPES
jgi:hypothetical protein